MRTTHQSDSAAGNGDGAARRSPHASGTPAHSGRERGGRAIARKLDGRARQCLRSRALLVYDPDNVFSSVTPPYLSLPAQSELISR